jgi:hypothetical protein
MLLIHQPFERLKKELKSNSSATRVVEAKVDTIECTITELVLQSTILQSRNLDLEFFKSILKISDGLILQLRKDIEPLSDINKKRYINLDKAIEQYSTAVNECVAKLTEVFNAPSMAALLGVHQNLVRLEKSYEDVQKEFDACQQAFNDAENDVDAFNILEKTKHQFKLLECGLESFYRLQWLDLLHLCCQQLPETADMIKHAANVKGLVNSNWSGFDAFRLLHMTLQGLWAKAFAAVAPTVKTVAKKKSKFSQHREGYASFMESFSDMRAWGNQVPFFMDFQKIKMKLNKSYQDLKAIDSQFKFSSEQDQQLLKIYGELSQYIDLVWAHLHETSSQKSLVPEGKDLETFKIALRRHQELLKFVFTFLMTQLQENYRAKLEAGEGSVRNDFAQSYKQLYQERDTIIESLKKIESALIKAETKLVKLENLIENAGEARNLLQTWIETYDVAFWERSFESSYVVGEYEDELLQSIQMRGNQITILMEDVLDLVERLLAIPPEQWEQTLNQMNKGLSTSSKEEGLPLVFKKKKKKSNSPSNSPTSLPTTNSDQQVPKINLSGQEQKPVVKAEDVVIIKKPSQLERLKSLEERLEQISSQTVYDGKEINERQRDMTVAIKEVLNTHVLHIRTALKQRKKALEGKNLLPYCDTGLEKLGYAVEKTFKAACLMHPMYSKGMDKPHDFYTKVAVDNQHNFKNAISVLQDYAEQCGQETNALIGMSDREIKQVLKYSLIHTTSRYLETKLQENILPPHYPELFAYLSRVYKLQGKALFLQECIGGKRPADFAEQTYQSAEHGLISGKHFLKECEELVQEADRIYEILFSFDDSLARKAFL